MKTPYLGKLLTSLNKLIKFSQLTRCATIPTNFRSIAVVILSFVSYSTQAAITSDDFNTTALNTGIWTVTDPIGDGSASVVGAGTADAQLRLSVPGGRQHNVWNSANNFLRVTQSAADENFEIEVKFDSVPQQKYQMQGILVEQDNSNFLRFDVYSNGTNLSVFAARFAISSSPTALLKPTVLLKKTIANAAANNIYLRLKRVENNWTATYSYDGQEWLMAKSFSDPLAVTSIGVFVGNAGINPAYTAVVDYVFNNAAPITPEDISANPASGGPTINVWYGANQTFGKAGMPQYFVNVLGNMFDKDGIKSASYSLNGGPRARLSTGPSGRLARPGDFNAEIKHADLKPGLNEVLLYAVDKLGNSSERRVTVRYIDRFITLNRYQIDWANTSKVSDVAQIVDGKWALESRGLRTLEPGYDRLVAVGDLKWTNFEATAEVTINKQPVLPPKGDPLLGFAMRWTGHYNWTNRQPRHGWWPLGAIGCIRWYPTNNAYQIINSGGRAKNTKKSPPVKVGIPYILKMRGRTVPGGELEYSIKFWEKSAPEPNLWATSWTSTPDDVDAPPGGSLLLLAHHVDVTFGNISVVPTN